ncbi:MAG TPA: hypothetical protein VGF95_00565 [Solirubrobacteraceae bacterium]
MRLNWRLYRLYLIPVAVTLMIAAFAFGNRPAPMRSTLVPEAFDGPHAFALLREMAALAPDPTPGSAGDQRLLGFIERQLRASGEAGRGGYSLRRLAVSAPTSLGKRMLTVLVAHRPGSTSAPPILLVAHRDALGGTRARQAQLSGSAALLEIALALANSETKHPLEIVFSDGGSAGNPGIAAYLESAFAGSADAALVLGDLGGQTLRRPLVQPFSDGFGGAPEALQNTVSASLGRALGLDAGAPSIASQLAHLIFPLTVDEEGALNAAGVPAVGIGLAGERGPAGDETVSRGRLESAGKAVLSAFYALDDGPEVPASPNHDLTFYGRTVPAWALRLLIGALLLAPIALCCDALVRLSRRREQAGRWISLSCSCAIPFFACAILVKLLAGVGLLSAPPGAAPAAALSFDAGAVVTIALAFAALALGLRAWWLLAARPLLQGARGAGSSGIAALATACIVAAIVWLFNPYAALLLIPGLHIWPLVLSADRRPGTRAARLALALGPLIPLGLVLLYYALALGLGPLQLLLSGTLLLGGGQVGWGAAVLWSLALGVLATVLLAALRDDRSIPSRPLPPAIVDKRARIGVGNV